MSICTDPEEDEEEEILEPDEPDEYLSESEAKEDTDLEAMESDQWLMH